MTTEESLTKSALSDKVKEFLIYYPEYKAELSRLRAELHKWTRQLYDNYRVCFINKKKTLRDFAHQFKPHMYHLHKLYLEELRTEGNYVSLSEVIKYVNNSFHALKITFANEVGNICQKLNIDSHEVMRVFGMDKQLNILDYFFPFFSFHKKSLSTQHNHLHI